MNVNRDLERQLADFYESEAPPRAPDWVLRSALQTIDDTPQRRVVIRVPWRFPQMNTFAKVAIAAVAVIAVGLVGWNMFGPRTPSGVGGQPTPSPSASPTQSSSPTASAAVAPPLSETFTSGRHGFSISYPSGWETQPATMPATSGFPGFGSPEGDFMFDPALGSDLFLVVTSRPLAGQDGAAWGEEMLSALAAADDCSLPIEPATINGGPGLMCTDSKAVTWRGDRGYVVLLYTSGPDPAAVAPYDQEYFRQILETIELRPEDAVDTAPSPSA